MSIMHSRYSDFPVPQHPSSDTILLGETDEDLIDPAEGKRRIERFPTSNSPPKSSTSTLRKSCYILHAALVVLHLCLAAVAIRHEEHKAIVAITAESNVLTTALSASLQAFYTLYTVILVYTTQRLAISRHISQRQPLTATHDAIGAWVGLGSALDSLRKQTKLATRPLGIISVTAYLLCTAGLHITSSSIMQFQNFNSSETVSIPTAHGWPDDAWFSAMVGEMTNSSLSNTWTTISSLAPVVGNISAVSTAGLTNGTIYDVLSPNTGIGNASVDAVTVTAHCGLLSGADCTDIIPTNLPWKDQVLFTGADQNTITFRVTTALNGNLTTLNKAVIPGNWSYMEPGPPSIVKYALLNTYLVTCNVSILPTEAIVDVQSNKLISITSQIPSSWPQWTAAYPSFPSAPLNESWAGYPFVWSSSPASDVTVLIRDALCVLAPVNTTCGYTLTTTESYLMQLIGLNTSQINPDAVDENAAAFDSDTTPTFTLSADQMENVLSQLLASAIWTAGTLGEANSGFDRSTGSANITQPTLAMRLNINWVPVSNSLVMLPVVG
ncbi:hypothetical protein BV22DRAFT_935569 [Leucogyrophana mollusca]|uniref:Uncharacterized protein n=1 Tax=Leucogyrophana mollusca TaxID=85980 RepID=A0ACB8AW12_9AGAM|nr:hypothetical protein BV22DRAFT_935569 [Leucogyrophana mollusca]